jgi:hypothetical protein
MFASLLFALLMHPVHETITEIDWNAETGKLEVAIRLHALDEQWIRRQHDREMSVEDVATAYIKKHVRVNVDADADADTATPLRDEYHWVGREEDGAHVWWYCEIKPENKTEPSSLRQTMLFEHEKNYVNRVVYLSRKPKLAQSLTIAKPVMDLTAHPDASSEEKSTPR